MSAAQHSLTVTPGGERDVVMTRSFNASRERLFDAHTTPELLQRWLTGPPGWTLSTCTLDLRVGGAYRFVWTRDDGKTMGMGGEYLEIARPGRLKNSEHFDDPWYEGEAISTVELAERDGVTTLTNTITYASASVRDKVLASPMESGVAHSYDKLDQLLR